MTIEDLKIEPEFRDLIPRLTDAEFAQLEKNILEDGRVREPIVVWKGIIIDGHHRYYILQKHPEIKDYKIEEKEFANDHAALAWACAVQLGRRNLGKNDMNYLIGKQYSETKKANEGFRGNQYKKVANTENQYLPHERTVDVLGRQYHISPGTVQEDEKYKIGIDIADEIIPGMKEQILHGDVNVPKIVVENISRVTPDKQRRAVLAISERDIKTAKEILEKEEPSIVEPEPYNINDMIEEVKAAGGELHFALNQTLIVMHQDVLADQTSKNKIVECLQDISDDAQEFILKVLEN